VLGTSGVSRAAPVERGMTVQEASANRQ